ncbi:MAG TPA: 16S rRNA (cytosine(967)-C(5))-methyltransferase RsmB, partial [Burkholderiaceae bacterium]|nr:16S rRNA (cytosine(967)-C(5))-methyltransferase RsmB [Burkholderiaceae bacterium]
HILQRVDCDLLALDADPQRCERIRANLRRERLQAQVRVGDARRPADWWDGIAFDRVLLDAPCSASGIVRRHPDVRWLRRRGDLETLSALQSELLRALWPLLRPGGTLLYVTCSVFPEEGEDVVARFSTEFADCRRMPLDWRFDGGEPERVAQLLPTSSDGREHDGFFYACLSKRS